MIFHKITLPCFVQPAIRENAVRYTESLESFREYVDEIYDRAPADIRAFYWEVRWALSQLQNNCTDENLSTEKLEKMMQKI